MAAQNAKIWPEKRVEKLLKTRGIRKILQISLTCCLQEICRETAEDPGYQENTADITNMLFTGDM